MWISMAPAMQRGSTWIAPGPITKKKTCTAPSITLHDEPPPPHLK
jgi:hypothetical protein